MRDKPKEARKLCSFRLSEDEHRDLMMLARSKKMTATDWIRDAIETAKRKLGGAK